MHYTKNTSRLDIDLNTDTNKIFVQQKWLYTWKVKKGIKSWTYLEKKAFHNKADKLIWSKWSNHFTLKVSGKSSFAKKNKDETFKVGFDLKWVLKNEHWKVNVTKISKGDFNSSNVIWSTRVINLDTEDVVKRSDINQYAVAHEFGHAIGNSSVAYSGSHGDEYKKTSSYLKDTKSMMNKGSELRKRHADFLIRELNTMIPDTIFAVKSIEA